MNQSEFEPGYFQKKESKFSSWSRIAFPSAHFCHADPGPKYHRVDIVPHIELSNYTLTESQGYIRLMYTAPGKSSVEVECWPEDWTLNLDEIMHWVYEHTKELNQ